jgi:hypothetical protein
MSEGGCPLVSAFSLIVSMRVGFFSVAKYSMCVGRQEKFEPDKKKKTKHQRKEKRTN